MGRLQKKLELFFDKMIVPALLMLLVIVVADLFFHDFKVEYKNYFNYGHYFIYFVFLGDLSFRFKKAKTFSEFLHKEWIEILAITPFFYVFRVIESIVRLGELGQELLHLLSRSSRFARLASRTTRLFAGVETLKTRDERFRDFLNRIPLIHRLEKWAELFKHPDED